MICDILCSTRRYFNADLVNVMSILNEGAVSSLDSEHVYPGSQHATPATDASSGEGKLLRVSLPQLTTGTFCTLSWYGTNCYVCVFYVLVWSTPDFPVQLSPKKALRAAMLKSRFADTILKAQQKTLLEHVRLK